MKLEGNRVLSDDDKVIAEKERGYGDWISRDDSVSISDILDFVNGSVSEEIEEIKEMGDLKIISYKLDQYDNTFTELKSLSTSLQPLASDLEYIKGELEKLKNKKIEMPDVDLSGIDDCKRKLDALAYEIEELKKLEARIVKVEKNMGSKFWLNI